MDVKVVVATHVKTPMPSDDMYIPLQVGAALHDSLGYLGDDTGDNISAKNDRYCELTGLYWAWKNLDNPYKGIVQYRRHFRSLEHKRAQSVEDALTLSDVETLMPSADILVPTRRNYRIQTLAQHLQSGSFALPGDIDLFRQSVEAVSPAYIPAFDEVMNRRWGHMFNMFITSSEYMADYCSWLFSVMDNLDERISKDRTRILGYFAEHMLDIWILKNKINYKEVPLFPLDRGDEVRRRIGFLLRLFGLKSASDRVVYRQK